MVAVAVVDLDGKKLRDVEVDADSLDKTVRKALLKEALIAYNASQRQGSHSTKTRGEVSGGSAKPYRQKGTGRARQGSRRATQFVGGGRAHGPKPRDYSYRLPTKQRRLAVLTGLRHRLEEGKLTAVEGIEALSAPKTKAVSGLMKGLGIAGKGALFVSEAAAGNLHLSARNIQKVDVVKRSDLNAGQLLRRPNLIVSAEALDALVKEQSA